MSRAVVRLQRRLRPLEEVHGGVERLPRIAGAANGDGGVNGPAEEARTALELQVPR